MDLISEELQTKARWTSVYPAQVYRGDCQCFGHAPEVVGFRLQLDQALLDTPELLQIDWCDVAGQVEEDPADSPGHSCQFCVKSACATDPGRCPPPAMDATAVAGKDARLLPAEQREALACGNHECCLKHLQLKGRWLVLRWERDVIIGGLGVPLAGSALLPQALAEDVQKLARACAVGLKQQTLVCVNDSPARISIAL